MVEGSFIVHGRLFHADDPEKDKLVLYMLMRGRGRMYNLLVRPYTDLVLFEKWIHVLWTLFMPKFEHKETFVIEEMLPKREQICFLELLVCS